MYADIFDPDTREEGFFAHAQAVFSCLRNGQQAELGILHWLREHAPETLFVATTDSHQEAIALYDNGASFVIQTEDLAAERLQALLTDSSTDFSELVQKGAAHREHLIAQSTDAKARFY